MADKGWTARISTAAGAAAGTGAAQLGLGYGLGVVVWPVNPAPDDSIWLGSLGWATWIAASATVFGAVIAARLHGTRLRGPRRLVLSASAAVGALVTVALIALPARSAVRDDALSPQVTAGAYAILGIALGLILAYWAVISRPVAANLMATAAWLWGLAITAIVVELTLHRSSATYLNSWQFAEAAGGDRFGTIYWPSAVLTLVAAFLLGVISVAPATRRGDLGTGAATSGAVGPLLVGASFLALAPQLTAALGPLESAYLIAPYAVLAGLGGSALTVTAARAAAARRARRAAAVATPPAESKAKSRGSGLRGGRAKGQAKIPTQPALGSDHESTPQSAESSRSGLEPGTGGLSREIPIPPAPRSDEPGQESRPKSRGFGLFGRRKQAVEPTPAENVTTSDPRPTAGEGRVRPIADAGGSSPGADRSTPSSSTDLPEPRVESAAGATAGPGRTKTVPASGSAKSRPVTASTAPEQVNPISGSVAQSKGTGPGESSAQETNSRPTPRKAAPGSGPAPAPTPRAASGPGPAPRSGVTPSSAQAPSSERPSPRKAAPARKAPDKSPGSPVESATDGYADPEIAAAAKPSRTKKAAPPAAPKSTITPPPANPTIAQINPKPSAD